MPDGAQATVLCEGLQDWVFVRRVLITLGVEARRIRVIHYPADGRGGAGEQHVRERYANEVRSHRSRVARTKAMLVVHTDADTKTVQERYASLESALDGAGVERRADKDAIVVLIPKRNTETWIHHFLDANAVDEEMSYPKFENRESETWPAAEAFAKHVQSGTTPRGSPPSLVKGLEETRRILAV